MSELQALTPEECAALPDAAFVAAFEAVALDVKAFDHVQHVRLGWAYLKHDEFEVAFQKYKAKLIKFASAWGHPGLYHETITWAYLTLIKKALDETPDLAWQAFMAAHPQLLQKDPPVIFQHYSKDLIASKEARQMVMAPDVLAFER